MVNENNFNDYHKNIEYIKTIIESKTIKTKFLGLKGNFFNPLRNAICSNGGELIVNLEELTKPMLCITKTDAKARSKEITWKNKD